MNIKNLKTVFMGTPEFSVPCLDIVSQNTNLLAVVTQPDKKKGRGQQLVYSPIKKYAVEHSIPVYQPEKIKNEEAFLNILQELSPDMIVVVAYGQILPKRVLELPKFGCINVHASLLPAYRGAAPMQWCLINGEKKTGITTMMMDEGLDTGDMLLKAEVDIADDTNLTTLHDMLMEMGAHLLYDTVIGLIENKIVPQKQDESLAVYSPMITKETGKIDWTKSADEIHNLIRALDSWPGAYCNYGNDIFKIWSSKLTDTATDGKPGEIVNDTASGSLIINTGDGCLEILEIQAPGKKRIKTKEYLNGHVFDRNVRFN